MLSMLLRYVHAFESNFEAVCLLRGTMSRSLFFSFRVLFVVLMCFDFVVRFCFRMCFDSFLFVFDLCFDLRSICLGFACDFNSILLRSIRGPGGSSGVFVQVWLCRWLINTHLSSHRPD